MCVTNALIERPFSLQEYIAFVRQEQFGDNQQSTSSHAGGALFYIEKKPVLKTLLLSHLAEDGLLWPLGRLRRRARTI